MRLPMLDRGLALLGAALLLAACGAAPVVNEPSAAPASSSPAASATARLPTAAPATVAPTEPPSPTAAAPTAAPPTAAPPTAAPTKAPTTAAPAPAFESEILFLRAGALLAYGLDSQAERLIAEGVSEVAATPDGRRLAVVREGEIWLLGRDGAGEKAITANELIVSGLVFAPDGQTLAYVASSLPPPRPFERLAWAEWCRVSEVRLIELAGGDERSIGPGCDVAFGPDGKRIAYASPPASGAPQTASNEIMLVSRAGENGWAFASSIGPEPERGLLVYAPSFAPDGGELAYQRYMGNQIDSEIVYMQAAPIFQGGGDLLGLGVGWLAPLRYAPGGQLAAAVEYNEDDMRGGSGYEVWRTTVLQLGLPGTTFAPEGELDTTASEVDRLPLAAGAAWAPDSAQLAVLLPTGWVAAPPNAELLFSNSEPGAIHLWRPGQAPGAPLVLEVDYASPLLWLPAS